MLWKINYPCSTERFLERNLVEVLYEFEGSKIFLAESNSLLYLWYEAVQDGDSDLRRFLVVPTDSRLVSKLKEGAKTVHDALNQPWLWTVDLDLQDRVVAAGVMPLEKVPIGSKPEKDATLWPHLEPLLFYRLIGEGLSEGHIPASVAARALGRPVAALKRLLESIGNSPGQGRPEEALRRAYDLPAQRFAFNSFEVSFGVPSMQLSLDWGSDSEYRQAAVQLKSAIAWLHSNDEGIAPTPSVQLLEVLKELAPPAHGQVVRAEIGGQLVGNGVRVMLSRDDRSAVTKAIARYQIQGPELARIEGRIGEFDKDNLTFILRDRSNIEPEVRCSFVEEQYDDLDEAFHSDRRVVHIGRKTRNAFEVAGA